MLAIDEEKLPPPRPAVAAHASSTQSCVPCPWCSSHRLGTTAASSTVGSNRSDALATVNQFAAARVTTVVFAVPVAVQRTWATEAAAQRFGYLVSDVDDGVTDERYPPTFEGARAHTSLRVPWYTRNHADTATQQACAAQWSSTQTPPAELPNEQVPVDGWCEGVSLLNSAITQAVLANSNLASVGSQFVRTATRRIRRSGTQRSRTES